MAEWLVLGVMLRIFVALVCAGGKEKELEYWEIEEEGTKQLVR